MHLASSPDGATFEPVDTNGTQGGAYPSLAVTPDGKRVFLAWYDVATQNILLGVLGDVTDILVANPSPTPEAAPPTSAPPAAECPKGGLELVAPAGAAATGFTQTTLSAKADTDFTICFDNQDPSVQHNVDVFDEQGGTVDRRRRTSSPARPRSSWTCPVSPRESTSISATSTPRR